MTIIGIDLGTTNTCVSVYKKNEKGGSAEIIEIDAAKTMPSIVGFLENETLVGNIAKNQRINKPKEVIYGAKRLIGRKFNEPAVKDIMKNCPYEIVEGKGGAAYIKVGDKVMSPAQVASYVLKKVAQEAESVLGKKIKKAVITVPAYFNDSQRSATKDAGKIAGLEVERIINEPTAAALAYGVDKKGKDSTIAVYDFGGGTFDISILRLEDGVFEVLATNGDTDLGGEKIDEKLIDFILKDIKTKNSVDLSKDSTALQRIKEEAEKAKIVLSQQTSVDINLPFLSMSSSGVPMHYNCKITRAQFESMISDIIESTLEPCRKCLKDADDVRVDTVILVGGSTKIPLVQQKVEEVFNKKPVKAVNPDEAVAQGAAIQGSILAGDNEDGIVLLDVTPLSLGLETQGGVVATIIERNSSIPCKKTQVFTTAVDNQTAVTIHVLQGERKVVEGNKSLGRFNLENIPPAPRGVPQIEVSFDIDTNGILNITAMEKQTQQKSNITIQANDGLSEEEIERMQEDAKKFADEDKRRVELNNAKNSADQAIYGVEKNLDKAVDAEAKSQAEGLIKELRDAMSADDLEKMKNITTQLQQLAVKLTPKQEPAGNNNNSASDNKNKTDDTVQDAEEVKPEK